ncbi:MAG: M28 family metallopeptidase [Gemmatimonadetes bacterium]|nr:M28 family metallopeptidase [Gemmatimonadota bacterium]
MHRLLPFLLLATPAVAQDSPPIDDPRIHEIVAAVSAEQLDTDVRTLVSFGTRSTLSDTLSDTRGIGAARRWIKREFDRIGEACGGCLEVFYLEEVFPPGRGFPDSTNVVNVVAIQRGTTDPNRMVIMSGDIDSRITDRLNAVDSSPGANDNASGMAGTIAAARVLTRYRFSGSIVYLGLSGEEQGLYGGRTVARIARERSWNIEAVLNNDMIGNIEGVNGVIDNTTARVFSDGNPPISFSLPQLDEAGRDTLAWALRRVLGTLRRRRVAGSDVDGVSRQIARYVDRIADRYVTNLDVIMIYRLDRFGRGGHHTPFADVGYPAVRIMETNENYTRQHQDIRVENGIAYGDVIAGVDFDYARKLTGLNVAVLASLSWAPSPPQNVRIGGIVQADARLAWEPPADTSNLAGYRVYWRRTDSPTWDFSRWVGETTEHTFHGLVIDNYYFGVAAVARDGNESPVAFPGRTMR